MTRPRVVVATPNLLPQLRRHLDDHLPFFQTIPGLVGISLNGGMSRGYADALSEVDVTLHLSGEAYRGGPLTLS